ncbi:hypothetical protein [Deinococcus roseus]|uniref:Uncharacterized protein n=1 Tax=Deinococcus roseus TaxID=392414 RepID=A0ABQ2DF97_9DEIO|nr:hypothetical protein [Deinococcus roseus]GGJ55682.1 hypothetical protein GCM10008938_47320 [Deinococcus roseus]
MTQNAMQAPEGWHLVRAGVPGARHVEIHHQGKRLGTLYHLQGGQQANARLELQGQQANARLELQGQQAQWVRLNQSFDREIVELVSSPFICDCCGLRTVHFADLAGKERNYKACEHCFDVAAEADKEASSEEIFQQTR